MRRPFLDQPVAAVVLMLLASLFRLMLFRDFTPANELRYLEIVDETIASGKLFAFTCHGEIYADKPPFFFWLMILCRLICGRHSMFAYSMLTFIPACVIIYVMDRWASRAFGLNFFERISTSLALVTTVMFLGMAVVIRMDMMMCMWIVLSLYLFWEMDNGIRPSKPCLWILPVLVFMALFTKGPVGLIMPVVSIAAWLVYDSRPAEIGIYLGWRFWTVLALLCALWFYGAWRDGGRAYLDNLLLHQTIDRAVNAFHHKEPFWYYGKAVWGALAPWCLAAVPAVILGLGGRGHMDDVSDRTYAFFSLTAAGCFLSLSCFSSKLSIYLGPIVPFAICCLPPMFRNHSGKRAVRWTIAIPSALFAAAGAMIAAASVYLLAAGPSSMVTGMRNVDCVLALLSGAVLLSGGVLSLLRTFRGDFRWWGASASLSISLLLMIPIASADMVFINDWTGYGNICSDIERESSVHTLNVRRAENMNVYLGRDVHDHGTDVDAFLSDPPEDGALVVKISALERNDGLASFAEGKVQQRYGKYALIGIGKNTVRTDSVRARPRNFHDSL